MGFYLAGFALLASVRPRLKAGSPRSTPLSLSLPAFFRLSHFFFFSFFLSRFLRERSKSDNARRPFQKSIALDRLRFFQSSTATFSSGDVMYF